MRYGVSERENLSFQKKNYEDTLESMELLLFLGHQSENVSFFNKKVLFYFFFIEAGQHAGFHQNYLWEKFLLTGGKGLLGLQLPLRYVEPDERRKAPRGLLNRHRALLHVLGQCSTGKGQRGPFTRRALDVPAGLAELAKDISSPASFQHSTAMPTALGCAWLCPKLGEQGWCFYYQVTLLDLRKQRVFGRLAQGTDWVLPTHGSKVPSLAGKTKRVGAKLPALQAGDDLGSDTPIMWVVEIRLH